jgi:hypothetical protein
MTLPRWLAAATAALLFSISVGLALVGVPEAAAGPGDVFANLGRNLVTTLALALLAYLFTSGRAITHASAAPSGARSAREPLPGGTEGGQGQGRLRADGADRGDCYESQ